MAWDTEIADAVLVDAVGRVALGIESPEAMATASGLPRAVLEPYAALAGRVADDSAVEVTIAVAAYNEADSLPLLWERLRPVLDDLESSELIVVDDGSCDATWAVVRQLAREDARVRGVRLSRNFGQQAALTVALEASRGRAVACIDADLQDPPELVLEMVDRWRAGADVVYAVRRTRAGGRLKRLAYRIFYRAYRTLAEIDVPLQSGDFALMDRRVVNELVALPERTRFLRGLRSWVGFRQEPLEYDRPDRTSGRPKYTLRKLLRLALDGLVSLSSIPLRVASILGVLVAVAGVLYVGIAVVAKVVADDVPQGWTSTVAIILFLGGAQLTVVGVLGEYVARIYDEVKRRPHALVAERTGGPSGR